MTGSAKRLLHAARTVATKNDSILANRWQVTAAALARQSIEAAVGEWMAMNDVDAAHANWKVQFLCLRSLHDDPPLASELHHVWGRLSESCHATSYEMPPTEQELTRWFAVIARFLASAEVQSSARSEV